MDYLNPLVEVEKKHSINKLLKYAQFIMDSDIRICYCLEEDCFFTYKQGVWIKIHEVELLRLLFLKMPETSILTINERKNILENLKTLKFYNLEEFNKSNLLNLKNGMLDPLKNELYEHSPDYLSTIQLDYEYNPESKCDLWLKTLNEILENDLNKINILQEYFGYCLQPRVHLKKALLLLGESDSGKSTIVTALRSVLGEHNCASVPLKYLPHPQYTPMLIGKMVSIDSDVAKDAVNYEPEFKIITSGEPINCNQKFIKAFSFTPKCKIILAANVFPKITDHSSAFYKRLLLIPCDRIFSEHEKNHDLWLQLFEERAGILNWMIKGLQRLHERGRFITYDFMKEAVQELEDENNPSNEFFNDHVEIAPVNEYHEIEKGFLYEKYKQWCSRTNTLILSKNRFSSIVYKKYHKYTPKQARHLNGGKRIWRNLRYIEYKNDEVKEKGWQE